MKNKTILVIIYNIFAVLLIFFLIEGATRIFYPEIKLPTTQHSLISSNVYYESPGLKPNSVGISSDVLKHVNESGFWKYSSQKKSTNKILIIGDSVTMGIGVGNDSTFSGILNNSKASVQILNNSFVGYSSKDYINIIRKLIEYDNNKLEVSSVFIFWCLNDVYANLPVTDSPELESDSFIYKLITLFRNNSYLYHLLKSALFDRPRAYYLFDYKLYNISDPHFNQSMNDLMEIEKIAEEHNLKIELFLLPYEYQIRDGFYEKRNSPQKLMTKILSNSKIRIHDCAAAFNKNQNSKDYYLYADGIHLSYQGHKAVAEYITSVMNSHSGILTNSHLIHL